MDQERENQESSEREISVDSEPDNGKFGANEFIEPLREVKNEPGQIEIHQDAEEIENDLAEQETPANHIAASDDAKEGFEKEDSNEGGSNQNEAVNSKTDKSDSPEKQTRLSKLAFSMILMVVVIVVLFAYANQWQFRLKKESPPRSSQPFNQKLEEIPAVSSITISKPEQNDPHQIYRVKLHDATRLRETLLLKKHEIGELKEHYVKGVKALEKEILYEILRNNIHNFQQALINKRIELRMRAIQRRLAYIQKLDEPLKWLEQGSEELLYLKRKASFDLQLIEIAGGIDMDMHMRHINAAVQKYRLTADNLAINIEGAKLEPMETIWNRLYSKTKNNPRLLADLENWFIEQEICSGELERIGELSAISVEAASCISQLDGSDLFLNSLKDLSPAIAEHLCQWKGKWICLNGVEILSPSAAENLFRWNGEWLSLNGLSEFPPELAKYLIQWKGKQLELMGLTLNENRNDKIALKYMAEWEKAGGKLFVPDSIRKMINMIKKI